VTCIYRLIKYETVFMLGLCATQRTVNKWKSNMDVNSRWSYVMLVVVRFGNSPSVTPEC
jgi:hypothetical protein